MSFNANYSDVVAIIFDGYNAHNICSILCIRILAVLVGQDQTGVGVMNLFNANIENKVLWQTRVNALENRSIDIWRAQTYTLYVQKGDKQNLLYTFTRFKSMGFMTEPWKNSTVVKWRLIRPESDDQIAINWVLVSELFSVIHLRVRDRAAFYGETQPQRRHPLCLRGGNP